MSADDSDDTEQPTDHVEQDLAGYLAGELSLADHEEVDQHLMGCDRCWREVQLVRAGRAAAIAATEPAPDELRRRLTAAFADQEAPTGPLLAESPRSPTFARRPFTVALLLVAASVIVAFLAGFGVAQRLQAPAATTPAGPVASSTSPISPDGTEVLAHAINAYRDARMPGTGVPSDPAPDLSSLGLNVMAACAGDVGGQAVWVYAYKDMDSRAQVFVYLSRERFAAFSPAPPNAASTPIPSSPLTIAS